MNDFRRLKIWQDSIELAKTIYQLTAHFPREEQYLLTSQIRKSIISVASNIAEGTGRNTKKDFGHFLGMALGSCFELETQLIIANKLEFIERATIDNLIPDLHVLQKRIHRLRKTLITE